MNCGVVNDSENLRKLEKNKQLLNLPLNILKEATDEFSKERKCNYILYKIYLFCI